MRVRSLDGSVGDTAIVEPCKGACRHRIPILALGYKTIAERKMRIKLVGGCLRGEEKITLGRVVRQRDNGIFPPNVFRQAGAPQRRNLSSVAAEKPDGVSARVES